jgi:hypothetical protein
LLLARIAAVHLRIPDLPDRAARERMEAEDRLIKYAGGSFVVKTGDWNPALHPRGYGTQSRLVRADRRRIE